MEITYFLYFRTDFLYSNKLKSSLKSSLPRISQWLIPLNLGWTTSNELFAPISYCISHADILTLLFVTRCCILPLNVVHTLCTKTKPLCLSKICKILNSNWGREFWKLCHWTRKCHHLYPQNEISNCNGKLRQYSLLQ